LVWPNWPLLAVDRGDVDDAAPAALDHIVDDLLGHVEQAGEVGLDDRVPVGAAHLAEHAVARDAGVVHQHIDRPVFALRLLEGRDGRIPVPDVADRGIEGVAERLLLAQPLVEIAARPATGDHREAVLVQSLAHRRADAAHATGHVCHFLSHVALLVDRLDADPAC
jgi:hypothetical protein